MEIHIKSPWTSPWVFSGCNSLKQNRCPASRARHRWRRRFWICWDHSNPEVMRWFHLPEVRKIGVFCWLVGSLEHEWMIFSYWECHHPNWLELHHFSEGWLNHQPADFYGDLMEFQENLRFETGLRHRFVIDFSGTHFGIKCIHLTLIYGSKSERSGRHRTWQTGLMDTFG